MGLLDLALGPIGWVKSILDPVQAVTGAIVRWQEAKLTAQNNHERIVADENIAQLQARRDALIAEAGASRLNMIVRAGLTLPVVILMFKILVWDKALGEWTGGRTDALSPEIWHVIMAIIGFYFLDNLRAAVTRR